MRALQIHLAPLFTFLESPEVTDIYINQPQEVFVEKNRQCGRHFVKELSNAHVESLAYLLAEYNGQEISPEKPLLSASLPTGERVQFVLPPACEKGKVIGAIRRQQRKNIRLIDYQKDGAFNALKADEKNKTSIDNQLITLYQQKDFLTFITLAIQAKKTLLISAGTGVGKTTFLNACLKEIPLNERLITLEDTREVIMSHPNHVHLLASKGNQGVSQTTMTDLFEASLRLRPDRILLSELRGAEVFAFLRAANSGHPGSLSTLHAESAEGSFEQLLLMMQQAGTHLSDSKLMTYLKSIIPIVIQLKRCPTGKRFMQVSEIYFDKIHHYQND